MNDVQETISKSPTDLRRAALRDRLIEEAEAIVAAEGLAALRARDLAARAGCSLGAVYNAVADLDEVALLVAQRTLAMLDAHLDAANLDGGDDASQLVAWALAYADFARAHRNRWRALFDYRTPPGKTLPQWFAAHQAGLFSRLEERLGRLAPQLEPAPRARRARTLFSAVHGVALLGLDEKLETLSRADFGAELETFVRVYLRGLTAKA